MKISSLFAKKQAETETFSNYEEALKKCGNEGYEDSALCRMIAKKTIKYKETLLQQPYHINAVQCYLVLTIQNVLLQHHVSSLSIADFGGACGAHYFETRRLIQNQIALKWNVIETPGMVKSAYDFKLNNHELNFVSNFDQVDADIFYLSSSIQYVPDPYNILNKLISKEYSYILFNRMMLNTISAEDEIIVQQSWLSANGPGPMPKGEVDKLVKYPHTTLSEQKFLQLFEPSYELVFRFDEASGKISGQSHISGGGFLFRKK